MRCIRLKYNITCKDKIHLLKENLFSSTNTMVCRRFEPPSIDTPLPHPLYGHPPLFIFSEPPLLTTFLWQYCPNEIWDKHKNKLIWQIYSFMFRRLRKTLHHLYTINEKQYQPPFYIQHPIWGHPQNSFHAKN